MAAAYPGDTFRAMLRATWLAMLCCLHASAFASPRSDPTQGRAAFTGASSPNPTSIEINPAALGLGPELNEFYMAATGVWNRQSIQRRTLDIDSGALRFSSGASARPSR